MYICVDCRRQMRCDKNGVGADFGNGHVYPSDRWECPDCMKQILVTNPSPIRDEYYDTQEEYLEIDD